MLDRRIVGCEERRTGASGGKNQDPLCLKGWQSLGKCLFARGSLLETSTGVAINPVKTGTALRLPLSPAQERNKGVSASVHPGQRLESISAEEERSWRFGSAASKELQRSWELPILPEMLLYQVGAVEGVG